MSIADITAMAARALEAGLLGDTCTITPAVAVGATPVSVTVRCAVVQPGGAQGGLPQGPRGGGGNQLTQDVDATFMLPRSTVVAPGDALRWVTGAKDFSVGFVVAPRSHDPLLYAQCVKAVSP
jgi:hypothetical protein